MAERTIALVLKTSGPSRVPGVRIPLPPPAAASGRGSSLRRSLELAAEQGCRTIACPAIGAGIGTPWASVKERMPPIGSPVRVSSWNSAIPVSAPFATISEPTPPSPLGRNAIPEVCSNGLLRVPTSWLL